MFRWIERDGELAWMDLDERAPTRSALSTAVCTASDL